MRPHRRPRGAGRGGARQRLAARRRGVLPPTLLLRQNAAEVLWGRIGGGAPLARPGCALARPARSCSARSASETLRLRWPCADATPADTRARLTTRRRAAEDAAHVQLPSRNARGARPARSRGSSAPDRSRGDVPRGVVTPVGFHRRRCCCRLAHRESQSLRGRRAARHLLVEGRLWPRPCRTSASVLRAAARGPLMQELAARHAHQSHAMQPRGARARDKRRRAGEDSRTAPTTRRCCAGWRRW